MKKIISFILIGVILGSAFLPGKEMKVIAKTEEKSKIATLVLGGKDSSLKRKNTKAVTYTYVSSNKKIALVSSKGVVTGKKKGKVTIKRYKIKNGIKKIDKKKKLKIVGIKMNLPKDLYTDSAYIFSGNHKNLKWSSSNPAVLTISSKGKVITNKAGSTNITAVLGKKKVSKTVMVKDDQVIKLEASYKGDALGAGEFLDQNKIHVKAFYISGKEKEVKDFGVDFKRSDILGEHIITVSYGGQQTTCVIKIVANSSATIAGLNFTHTITDIVPSYSGKWYLDQGMDLSKLTFLVSYTDGKQEEISASDVKILTNVNEEGQKEILLSYKINGIEYTSVLSVEVIKRKPVALEMKPKNGNPVEGDKVKPEDYTVTVVYEDGSKKIVDNWTSKETIFEKAGENQITISYEEGGMEITQSISIMVDKLVVTSLTVTNAPKSVIEGNEIDYTGMKVVAAYNNGMEYVISKGEWDSNYNASNKQIGERTVEISYKEGKFSFVIIVKKSTVVSITATNPSASTPVGSQLNARGIAVTAKFDDGTSKVVTGWISDYAPSPVAGNVNTIISYGGKQCTITVHVSEPLFIQADTGGTIAGHKVMIKSNYIDVDWSIVGGGTMASLNTTSGNQVTLTTIPKSSGWVTIRGQRQSTGEIKEVSVGLVPYDMVMTSEGNVALGDTIRFDTNGISKFNYALVKDGKIVESGAGTDGLAFLYTTTELGEFTVTATDKESGEQITITCVVRKALGVEGESTVAVGKKITLTTTKNNVLWSSSNNGIASVSSSGVVKGVKKGTVSIVATFPDYNNRTVSKTITVK